jgi:hypothetical protein
VWPGEVRQGKDSFESWWRFRKSSRFGMVGQGQLGPGPIRPVAAGCGKARQGLFELVAFANCHGTAPSGGAWRDRARRGMARTLRGWWRFRKSSRYDKAECGLVVLGMVGRGSARRGGAGTLLRVGGGSVNYQGLVWPGGSGQGRAGRGKVWCSKVFLFRSTQ